MRINGQNSSFQSIILEMMKDKLSLMISEVLQLKTKIHVKNHEKLTKIILREIARGNIKSIHLTPKQAKGFIRLFDKMSCHMEYASRPSKDPSLYSEDNNPYAESPFK